MLDKPDLDDSRLTELLAEAYGLDAVQLGFLPLGADPNTAVYRAVAPDKQTYFVKLRCGAFDEMSVTLPRYLKEHGVPHLIPVVATTAGELWAALEPYTVIVHPFVTGRNGYEAPLTEQQWPEFGAALQRLHTLSLPPELQSRLRRETYDASAREQVKAFLSQLGRVDVADPITERLVAFMKKNRVQIIDFVGRAERLADTLKTRVPEFALCHSDLHAGNVLIANNSFYLVDWDEPILAPKERDLMFVGGAQGFLGRTPQEEERLFYKGYGEVVVDPVALAYYRTERVVQDVAVFCEEIMRGVGSAAERERSLGYLTANFRPGGTLERADAVKADPGV